MKPILLLSAAGYLGLAYLTRNDSIIFAILIWSYIFWETRIKRTNHKCFYQLLEAIGLYFLFVIGQLMFQYLYYGELLPNTYALKLSGMPLLARLNNGIGFVKPLLVEVIVFLILASVDVIFHVRRRKLFLLFLVLSAIGYQVYVGGDLSNYWRMISPSIPLLIILFISALNSIMPETAGRQVSSIRFLRNPICPSKYNNRITIISLTLIGLLWANMRFLPEISLLAKPRTAKDNQINVNTAIALGQLTTSEASVGVYWAGSIPYYLDRKAIDFLGKSDRYIAHLPPDMSGAIGWHGMTSVPGHNKYDLYYSIVTLRPTYVQGFVWGTQDLSQWAKTKYVKVEYDGVSLFLLRDSPAVLWDNINIPDD